MVQAKEKIPVIAIDGPSGSGKGTIARNISHELGYHLLDSGALYRLVAFQTTQAGLIVDSGNELNIAQIAVDIDVKFSHNDICQEQIWLSGKEISKEIRTEECGRLASNVAALPAVRKGLLELQKSFRKTPGLVADGRDMGTTVFPDAILKVYLTASVDERAKRRLKQLNDKGIDVSLAALLRDIQSRDKRDSERKAAPLKRASDARIVDSSNLTIEEVTQMILGWVKEQRPA
ncbi:MAG: cytidylate kinase [Woeseia sp.]|nr:cytidylate kinase [Woeseia sp.]|tara:strand:- start:1104 stop:1802 length:699 start_codon:yes stop_codon:yes gene_type:complete